MRLRCGPPNPLSSMPLSPGSSGRNPQRRIFRFPPLWLDSDRVAWGSHANSEHFLRCSTRRQPSATQDALQARPEAAFELSRTCGGRGAPEHGWGWALRHWGNSLLPPLSAPDFAPLGTCHTDLATAQQRVDCRTNPPRTWCNRARRSGASG